MDFEHSDEIANLFKMFSDKTRVNILLCLKEKRECSVDEISELLGMEQSAISHQLRILRQGRLVKQRKEGRYSLYSLDDLHVELILNLGKDHVCEGCAHD